ncbi:MAG: hypothetical protein MHM6MM_006780, partial [Cercozoa sp. M6MM]
MPAQCEVHVPLLGRNLQLPLQQQVPLEELLRPLLAEIGVDPEASTDSTNNDSAASFNSAEIDGLPPPPPNDAIYYVLQTTRAPNFFVLPQDWSKTRVRTLEQEWQTTREAPLRLVDATTLGAAAVVKLHEVSTDEQQAKAALFSVRNHLRHEMFAEEFILNDGLQALVSLLESTQSIGVKKECMKAMMASTEYASSIEMYSSSDVLPQLFSIAYQHAFLNSVITRTALEIGLVVCHFADDGFELLRRADAIASASVDRQPVEQLVRMLGAQDFDLQLNALTLINAMLFRCVSSRKKRHFVDQLEDAGIARHLRPMLKSELLEAQIGSFREHAEEVLPATTRQLRQLYQRVKELQEQVDLKDKDMERLQKRHDVLTLKWKNLIVDVDELMASLPAEPKEALTDKLRQQMEKRIRELESQVKRLQEQQLLPPPPSVDSIPPPPGSAPPAPTTVSLPPPSTSAPAAPPLNVAAAPILPVPTGAVPAAAPPAAAGVPAAAPPPNMSVPAAAPPPNMGVPAAAPPPNMGVPAAAPPPNMGVPAAAPPPGMGVPAAAPPPNMGVPAAAPPPSMGVPAAAPPPGIGGVPAAAPPPMAGAPPPMAGAPPPMAGAPPPLAGSPPPLGAGPPPLLSQAVAVVEPSRASVKPSKKLKALYWKRTLLTEDDFKQKKTVWASFGPRDVPIDVAALEAKFAQKSAAKPSASKPTASVAGAVAAKAKTKQRILDGKRSNALGIFGTTLPPKPLLVKSLLALDTKVLRPSQVQQLLSILPTEEEVESCRSLDPAQPIDLPEQLVLTLSGGHPSDKNDPAQALQSLRAVRQRLNCWSTAVRFQEEASQTEGPLQTIADAGRALRQSKELKKVLALVLSVGNYLNGGTKRGQADAFDVEFLPRLGDTKGVDGTTLLDYVASVYNDGNKATLSEALSAVVEANSLMSLGELQ